MKAESLILWTGIAANVATIVAGVVAFITIPLAYYQIRKGEQARRMELLETRVIDAYLQLPPEPILVHSFSGAEYRELVRDFHARYGVARLLTNWRKLAGVDATEPMLSEVWHKLAFELIVVENNCQSILTREGVDLTSYEDLTKESQDGAGGFTNLWTLVRGGQEMRGLCEKLRRALSGFDATSMDVMTRTLAGKDLRR